MEKQEAISAEEFQTQFVRLLPHLRSYLFRLTAHRQDTEDMVQETYLKAGRNLSSFAGKARFKTWVFAIATNLAKDNFRARQRWREDIQDRCRTATQAAPEKVERMREIVRNSPAERYEFKEHIDYCFTCIAKTLEIEQQVTLILKEIYDFKVAEIMDVLQMSEGQVKYALAEARRILADIFDRRCALVNKQGVCYQCSEINGFINPKQEERAALVQIKMYNAAQNGASREHLFDLRTELVRGIDPLNVPGTELHTYLIELMPQHNN